MFGCGGPSLNKELYRPTLTDLDNFDKTLSPKIAVAVVGRPGSKFGDHMTDLFVTSLMDTLRKRHRSIRLLTPQDAGYPQFLADMTAGSPIGDAFAMSEQARLYGLQGILIPSFVRIPVQQPPGRILAI